MIHIKDLLIPLDFSEISEPSLDYSIALAQNHGARLHLLHVVVPPVASAYDSYIDIGSLLVDFTSQAEEQLTRLAARATNAGVPVKAEVRTGEVVTEILDFVQSGIEMIVMGKHGRSGWKRFFLGSVTERLIRKSPVPILILNEGRSKNAVLPDIQRIVMATDFSDGASEAVAYTLSLASQSQSQVTFLHVIPEAAAGFDLPYEKPIEEVQELLTELLPAAARSSDRVETRIESGVPHKEILKFVRNHNPDLLVLNIHKKGALERVLLGATAGHVIREAPCPVLVVPTKQTEPSTKRRAA